MSPTSDVAMRDGKFHQDQIDSKSSKTLKSVAAAYEMLDAHPHFYNCRGTIEIIIDEQNQVLLTGVLPSFYLKQLAQECLRPTHVSIRNEIEVIDELPTSKFE